MTQAERPAGSLEEGPEETDHAEAGSRADRRRGAAGAAQLERGEHALVVVVPGRDHRCAVPRPRCVRAPPRAAPARVAAAQNERSSTPTAKRKSDWIKNCQRAQLSTGAATKGQWSAGQDQARQGDQDRGCGRRNYIRTALRAAALGFTSC